MKIKAGSLNYSELNEAVRQASEDVVITDCMGQRFIGAGMSEHRIRISGIPGNALGAYLDGACIEALDNAQDAVGDTMNAGTIIVRGDIGDTTGYAMRGGAIYVQGNAGYRTGIHMKAYRDKVPVIVIGGSVGSFLGEYQAGGIIIVLGLNADEKHIVGQFPCTGMHGGKLYIRSDCAGIAFPAQVNARAATDADKADIQSHLTEFCRLFDRAADDMINAPFTVITPNSHKPYELMYVAN